MSSIEKSLSIEPEEEEPDNDESREEVGGHLMAMDTSDPSEDEAKPNQAEQEHGPLYRFLVKIRCHCLARFLEEWPRVSSIFIGVVFPLWLLISIAYFFGMGLATLEAPQEIQDNDVTMSHYAKLDALSNVFANISANVLIFCLLNQVNGNVTQQPLVLTEFLDFLDSKQNLTNSSQLTQSELEAIVDRSEELEGLLMNTNETVPTDVGTNELKECKAIAQNLTHDMFVIMRRYSIALGGLTFNWIRCGGDLNEARPNDAPFPFEDFDFDPQYKPEAQKVLYAQTWIIDRDRILDALMLENPDATLEENVDMWIAANNQASGSKSCEPNSVAAAWFWFTVMTTIGYGNQAPITAGGRTLVFTLGFLSLLVFGGVLAYAGFVISEIVDDALRKSKRKFWLRSGVSCLMWGCLAYSWMLVLAYLYMRWRRVRLDDAIPLRDGYWYAYISTTTIGLGDFHLEPEVIAGRDLISFPLVILMGFVLFSAFLGKLADLLTSDDPPSQTFERRLKETRLCACCCCHRPPPS